MRNRLIFKNMQREIVGQSGEISEGDTHNDNSAQKSVQSPFAEVEEGNKDQINIKGSDGKKDRVSV